jgi:hypothetical protein
MKFKKNLIFGYNNSIQTDISYNSSNIQILQNIIHVKSIVAFILL